MLCNSEQVFEEGKKSGPDASEQQEENDELYKQIGQRKEESD